MSTDEEELIKNRPVFTVLSMCSALAMILFIGFNIYKGGELKIAHKIIYITITALGILLTYLSFRKPEPFSFIRWLAACLNVFYLLFLGATQIAEFAN